MNRALLAAGAALTLIASLVFGSVPAGAAQSGVRIVAIYFDSPGSDTGSNTSLNAEWVKIHNFTDRRRTLTGWRLRDSANHVYTFPTFRLAAGASVRVHTGHGSRTQHNLYWGQSWYIWNNDGDTAVLKRANGTRADRCAYSESQDPEAYC